jgi:putative endonuclease
VCRVIKHLLARISVSFITLIVQKFMYLYILKCSDGSFYTGVSSNLEGRLAKHEAGYYPDCYTFRRRPVELVFSEQFVDFHLAFEWETRIKKWSRAKKEALVNGDFERLIVLSKKKY